MNTNDNVGFVRIGGVAAIIAALLLSLHMSVAVGGAISSTGPASTQDASGATTAPEPASKPSTAPGSLEHSSELAGINPDEAETVTAEFVQGRILHIEQSSGLNPKVAAQAMVWYRQAAQYVQSARESAAKAAEYAAVQAQAPGKLASMNAQLGAKPAPASAQLPADAPLSKCQAMLDASRADQAQATKEYMSLKEEPQRRSQRRQEISSLLGTATAEMKDVRSQLNAPTQTGEDPELTEARKTMLQAREQLLRRQIVAYWQERRSYDATGAILAAQKDLAVVRMLHSRDMVKAWQDLLGQRRNAQAQQALDEAMELAQGPYVAAAPAVKALAQENCALARQRVGPDGLSAKLDRAAQDLQATQSALARLRNSHKRVIDRVQTGGNSKFVGDLLRQQRSALADIRRQNQTGSLQAEISGVQMALLDLEEQRSRLADIDRRTVQIMDKIPAAEGDREALQTTVRTLLQKKRDYLSTLTDDYNSYFSTLSDLDGVRKALTVELTDYSRFIDERELWIRSAPVIGGSDFAEAWETLCHAKPWRQAIDAIWSDLATNIFLPLGCGILFVGFVLARKASVRWAGWANSPPDAKAHELRWTLWWLGRTLLAAAWAPLLLWLIAWRLAGRLAPEDEALGVAAGLRASAIFLFTAGALFIACRPKDLAQFHPRWAPAALAPVRKAMLWLMVAGLPLVFVLAMVEAGNNEAAKSSLGRTVFIALMLGLAIFAHRVGLAIKQVLPLRSGWLHRSRHLWHVLAVAIPLALAASAAAGYYYTAMQLSWRLLLTIWLALVLVPAITILVQAISAIRQKLALLSMGKPATAQANESGRSRAATAALPAQGRGAQTTDWSRGVRMRRLLMIAGFVLGAWLIWSDVSPAFDAVGKLPLWMHTVSVSPSEGPAAGVAEKLVAVTLGDLLLAIILFLVSLWICKEIPGLLGMALYGPLKWSLGGRYAFTMVLRYVIAVGTCVAALTILGISWSGIQWLVAAVTVGLGFGLQEIFANFVSGLIVLFERPIRLGDVVTVGNVTGTVTRIQIRATTIVDFDRKDLIVPNKEFITNHLINWTLSDTVLRVVIPLGLAYGSDVQKAKELLVKIAKANPLIMEQPAPAVYFMNFGKTCLELELLVFVRDLQSFTAARDQLNMAIERIFREAGINLASSQLDINIRSLSQIQPIMIKPQDAK